MNRPRARGLVEHVHGVPVSDEVLHPAFPSIRGAGVIQAALAATREHDDRIAVSDLTWNLKLDVHLARHESAVRRIKILSTDEEISLSGDDEGRPPRSCRCSEQNQRDTQTYSAVRHDTSYFVATGVARGFPDSTTCLARRRADFDVLLVAL